ncbi:MAG: tRNA (cytidine(34)-2'-O)-methyltransferase [Pseudomonadota bacterium]|nr:tRNA (cytidine(34)-2'-O)-methyltransferase [Pseudomonadota bacterium]
MFQIILYQPEIPPNTGNIIRLIANTGASLHLIEPLGFDLDEKKVRRAGLDYHELSQVTRWPDWSSFQQHFQTHHPDNVLYGFTTKGSKHYHQAEFLAGDGLLFGPETRGLPADLLEKLPVNQKLRLPMQSNSRSLNLSNTVAIALYEAFRQNEFPDLL